MIRLLYKLTKERIKKMRTRELDDVERQLASVEKDAARYGMSNENRARFDATRNAIREEKGIRTVRDEEYGIMQDELRGASELIPVTRPPTGGIQSIAKMEKSDLDPPESFGPMDYNYLDKIGPARSATYIERIKKLEKGNEVIPEFSTKNLTKVEVESGVPGQAYSLDERAGWMGPRISEQGNPLKLKDMTFGQLDEAQQGVYRIVKEADIPELSDPGVLSDLLDYTRRVGRGRNPDEIVSEYWKTKGTDIREYLDIRTTTGEIPPGMPMDDFLGL